MKSAPPTIISHTHSPSRVLKQSIVWTKHLVREEIEPLPGHTPIVETRLSLELDVESGLEMLNVSHIHDHVVRVFKEMIATQRDV